MKILIVGLPGTGKTTFAKILKEKYGFQSISDWDIFAENNIKTNAKENKIAISSQYSKILLNQINALPDNFVVDLEYSISPNDFVQHNTDKSLKIVYLGFISLENNTLFNLFRKNKANKNYSDSQLMEQINFYKEMSKQYQHQCNQHNISFFDINKDRQEAINDILKHLNLNHD